MDLLSTLNRKEEDYNVYGEIILRVVFIKETQQPPQVSLNHGSNDSISIEGGESSDFQFFGSSKKKEAPKANKPDIPSIMVMNVSTKATIGDLRERIKLQYDLQFEHQFIFAFEILEDDETVPIGCFESLATIDTDDYYRPRLILVINLNCPFQLEEDTPLELQSPISPLHNHHRERSPTQRSGSRTASTARSRLSPGRRHRSRSRMMLIDYDQYVALTGEGGRSTFQGEEADEVFQPFDSYLLDETLQLDGFSLYQQLETIQCQGYSEALMKAGFYQEGSFAALTEEDFHTNRIFAPKVVRDKILKLAQQVKSRLDKPRKISKKPEFAPTARIVETNNSDTASVVSTDTHLSEYKTKAELKREWEKRERKLSKASQHAASAAGGGGGGGPKTTESVNRKEISASATAKILAIQRQFARRKDIDPSLTSFNLPPSDLYNTNNNNQNQSHHDRYCCTNHKKSTRKQQDILKEQEGQRLLSALSFNTAFQNSLGDTLLSLEESLPEISRLLSKLGYRNIDEGRLYQYLKEQALLNESEMEECERYLAKGFHVHSVPATAMTGSSTISKLPICLYSKERIVESTVNYLFEYHSHELLQAAK